MPQIRIGSLAVVTAVAAALAGGCGSQAPVAAPGLDAAAATPLAEAGAEAAADAQPEADAADVDGAADTGAPSLSCDSLSPLPWAFRLKAGPPASEDFTFDNEGYLLALSKNNLVRLAYDGAPQLVAGNVALNGTGARVLANGDIVVADEVRGVVVRIDAMAGRRNVGTNIRSPNGIQIGPGGRLYVTDMLEGNLHLVDPDAATTTLLGFVVDDADGLVFSVDYKTLFVNSFSTGEIHRMTLKADGTVEEPQRWVSGLLGADGMTIDECGNLYVTGYKDGILRRVSSDGKVEVVADFGVSPITAVSFGSGKQGWNDRHLFVMNHAEGGVFELEVGVRGAPPPPTLPR